MADINYFNLLCTIAQVIQRRRLCIAAILLIHKKRKNKKRCWVSDFLCERKIYGAYYTTIPTLLQNPNLFINYCRMSATLFEELCILIAPKIRKQTLCRDPIPPDQRLLLTLRYKIYINNLLICKLILSANKDNYMLIIYFLSMLIVQFLI